jgi:lipoate---protein ligase
MIGVKKYNLPDFDIFESDKDTFKIWIPDKTYIILGTSNNPEESLNIENVFADSITVYKRPSGGQAVVLTPYTIIVSVLLVNSKSIQPKDIFEKINSVIINSLNMLGVKTLSNKGISDIAINDKKILGSSIYRSRNKTFYHAVINYNESAKIFERYLKHPLKEPDYRKGRNHIDFITSVKKNNEKINNEEIVGSLKEKLNEFIRHCEHA